MFTLNAVFSVLWTLLIFFLEYLSNFNDILSMPCHDCCDSICSHGNPWHVIGEPNVCNLPMSISIVRLFSV